MPRDKCGVCFPKAPSKQDLRRVIAMILGPYAKLQEIRPIYWPAQLEFVGGKTGYSQYKVGELLILLKSYYVHILGSEQAIKDGQLALFFSALASIRPTESGLEVCCDRHNTIVAFDAWVDEIIYSIQLPALSDRCQPTEPIGQNNVNAEVATCDEIEPYETTERVVDDNVNDNANNDSASKLFPKRKRSALSTRCAPLKNLPFKITIPRVCDKGTSFYPTIAQQYTPLLAIIGDLFHGKKIGDFCCGKGPRYVYNNLVRFKPKTIFLSDKHPAKGIRRLDLEKIEWEKFNPQVDIIISSLPYARGKCEPLLASCLQSNATIVCLKLLHSFERPVVGDSRASAFQRLGLKILLPPAKYPGFDRSLGEVEAWYIFFNLATTKDLLKKSVSEFHNLLYEDRGYPESAGSVPFIYSGVEHNVASFKDRGLILWDSRKQAAGANK